MRRWRLDDGDRRVKVNIRAVQPLHASLSFGGRTFTFDATDNAAAGAVSLSIGWMYGVMREELGPKPLKSWSTMEAITTRAAPRD